MAIGEPSLNSQVKVEPALRPVDAAESKTALSPAPGVPGETLNRGCAPLAGGSAPATATDFVI